MNRLFMRLLFLTLSVPIIIGTFYLNRRFTYIINAQAAPSSKTKDSMSIYSMYLPYLIKPILEIDQPTNRWPHNFEQTTIIDYIWEDITAYPEWYNAFYDGLTDWDSADTLIDFDYDFSSSN